MNKIFGIGFHKTGTHSLGAALEILEYKTCGFKRRALKEIKKDNLNPAFDLAKKYDAFQDFPWPLLYKELDKKFPNSKFILTIRESNNWIKSNLNHFGSGERESLKLIYGVGHPKGNEQIYLNRYNTHNQEVLEYFKNRPNDLLILNFQKGDGWIKLCNFLDKKIPSEPFPHKQKAQYGIKKYFKKRHIKKILKRIWNNASQTCKKIGLRPLYKTLAETKIEVENKKI